MRAAVFKGVGQPLAIEQRPDPEPKADELVLKVGRCGICGTDLSMTDGSGQVYELNSVIGHEFAGEVVAVGKDASHYRVGDRVTALPFAGCGHCQTCLAGRPNFCAQFVGMAGGFAEYLPVKARTAVALPKSLSMADGALIEPLAVGMHGVAMTRLAAGSRVLVIGAGPIGLAAAFWARQLGAGPIAVTASSRRRADLALAMGASAFVLPENGHSLAEVSTQALGGMPDIVIEAVGKKGLIAEAIQCVRPEGTVMVLGFCMQPDRFVPAMAVWKEVRLMFGMTYSIQEFEHVARVLDRGDVEPRAMVTETVGLDALPAMLESLRSRQHQCKVLVDPWAKR